MCQVISLVCRGCKKDVSSVYQGVFQVLTKVFQGFSKVLQGCSNGVPSLKSVLKVCQTLARAVAVAVRRR